MRTKICKYCKEPFRTGQKYAEVCPSCFKENHQQKVERNLFNREEPIMERFK